MKKIASISIVTIISTFFFNRAFAQQDYNLVNILPPAPNAASLGKYAGISTGLSSGTAKFSITLFNYTSKNINLPLSISYATNGFKVDEIASRVGNQWALNAGGVITRTVLGGIDERVNRIYPAAPLGSETEEQLWTFADNLSSQLPLQGVGPEGSVDGQPDMFTFNFNGYTGRFILDTIGPNRSLRPVLLANSGLKIDLTNINTDKLGIFTITTNDGTQYVFGDDGTELTINSSTGNGNCGPNYAISVPTAWYLKKIIHPNGDQVNFYYSPLVYDYQTGRNESIYMPTGSGIYGGNHVARPSPQNTSCINSLETNGVILDSIKSTYGNKIKFNYINRTGDNDKLLSSIIVYRADNRALLKTFSFNYTDAVSRPFLKSLFERDSTNQLVKKHLFGYNDMFSVPGILSYSQDYWGYFNGKSNNTLIPQPKDPDFAQTIPLATANRDPDPIYTAKGLLNSITYPTGGKDSVLYEGNQAYQTVTVYPVQQTITVNAINNTSSGASTITTSSVFTLSYRQQVHLSVFCGPSSSTASWNDTRGALVEFINGSGTTVTNYSVNLPDVNVPSQTLSWDFILDPGNYTIKVTTYSEYVKSRATFTYRSGSVTSSIMNAPIGGVRVAKILTYDGVSNNPVISKYLYGKLSNPDQSSAVPVTPPTYEQAINLWANWVDGTELNVGICLGATPFPFNTSSSNALLNIFQLSSPATYANVTESFGDNFENGGIEHEFSTSMDRNAGVYRGQRITGAPNGNESYRNGFETYRGTFKLQGSQRIYLNKVYTHYEGLRSPYLKHPDQNTAYNGYIATQNFFFPCVSADMDDNTKYFKNLSFNLSYYFIHRSWIYADTVKTLTYDTNGQNYVQSTTIYDYQNTANALPTSEMTFASTGDTLKTLFNYPSDFSSTSPYNTMVTEHILGPVVIKARYYNSTPVDFLKTNYFSWGHNIFAPQTVQFARGTQSYETRSHYYGYDNVGNITVESQEKGSKISYIWDYKKHYPIAEIKNADSSAVAYTSFEADGSGHWTVSSAARSFAGFTGNLSYSLANGTVSKSGLITTQTYKISYWTTNGSPLTIAGTIAGYPKPGITLKGWTYYEHLVTGITSVSLTGTGIIDELCLYPLGAQISTYTYDPFLGIISSINPKGEIKFYEYDSFQRLMNIKDQYGNIVTHTDYHYKGQ